MRYETVELLHEVVQHEHLQALDKELWRHLLQERVHIVVLLLWATLLDGDGRLLASNLVALLNIAEVFAADWAAVACFSPCIDAVEAERMCTLDRTTKSIAVAAVADRTLEEG